ncbi:hypothetical protein LCGC14_0516430 [marine sediment metagenome]|uniref:Uncharacterized protein n=1 Tax=marine sediment metagenome TaxID=412755 RepID=A0A0F9RZR9_9ZZZZ
MVATGLLEFEQITVKTVSLDFLLVEWVVKPTNRPIDDFDFVVLRSQSPKGPFSVVSEELESIFAFADVHASQKARWRQWHYKVRVIERDTEKFSESEIVTNSEKPDRIALAIIRRNNLLLRVKNGIDAFAFIERTFGQKCTCMDPVKSRKRRSDCPICLGTTFVGGFLDPIQIKINVSPSPKVSQFANMGELQPNQTAAWMSNFPEIKQRDVIVEAVANGTRWRVTRMTPTRKNRALVHQNLLLTEINRSDIEWKLELPTLEKAS